jgi:hypothetical protein
MKIGVDFLLVVAICGAAIISAAEEIIRYNYFVKKLSQFIFTFCKVYSVFTQFLLSFCSVFAQFLCSVSLLSFFAFALSLIVFLLSLRSVYAQFTLSLRSVYTQFTLSFSSVYYQF